MSVIELHKGKIREDSTSSGLLWESVMSGISRLLKRQTKDKYAGRTENERFMFEGIDKALKGKVLNTKGMSVEEIADMLSKRVRD